MTTYVLSIADPHWTEKKPRSRKDLDWKQTQATKIRSLFTLAEKLKLPGDDEVGAKAITIAGDCFHQPEGRLISRKLETWLIPVLRDCPVPLYTIPGNHDMRAHRLESLEDHPYGVMVANGIFTEVSWPTYYVVGDDPPVIITGYPFKPTGATEWFEFLRQSEALFKLKDQVSVNGKRAQCLAMTHGWWGPTDGTNRGEPLHGYSQIRDTGIDAMVYGHPHTLDGVSIHEDSTGQKTITGPGAFIRGTLAEHDVTREPKIMISIFKNDGTHEVRLVSVPHQKADDVFDFETNKRAKRSYEVKARFVKELTTLDLEARDLDEIISEAATKDVPSKVVSLARQYITRVKETMK